MPPSFQAQTDEILADPRLASCAAMLVGAIERGDFPDRFAELFQPIYRIPLNELGEIGGAIDRAMRLRSDAAKASALDRLGAKVVKQYVAPGHWSINEREGEPGAAKLARMIFGLAAEFRRRGAHDYEPKFSRPFAFRCVCDAYHWFRARGAAPTENVAILMAHKFLVAHGGECSISDVEGVVKAYTRGLPMRAWLDALHGEASRGDERRH